MNTRHRNLKGIESDNPSTCAGWVLPNRLIHHRNLKGIGSDNLPPLPSVLVPMLLQQSFITEQERTKGGVRYT